jgi:hypothetical protein
VTVTATVTSGSRSNKPTFTFQLYLDGNGNALELGVDSLQSTSRLSFVQQSNSSDFAGNYAANVYGYSETNTEPAWSAAGPVTFASDTFTGYTDYSLQNATNSASVVTSGIALTGSESSSTGLLTLQGPGDLPGPSQTNSGLAASAAGTDEPHAQWYRGDEGERRMLMVKSGRGDGGQVLISVSDTGVGLPAGRGDEIFNAFFTTKLQGSGMGLAISRSIVESYGGRLWATSNDGRWLCTR